MTIRYAEERTKGEGKGDPGGPVGPGGPSGLGGPHGLDDPGGPGGPPFADFELWTEFNLMKIRIYFPQTSSWNRYIPCLFISSGVQVVVER